MENPTGSLFFFSWITYFYFMSCSPFPRKKEERLLLVKAVLNRSTSTSFLWDQLLISFLRLVNLTPQTCWLWARQTRVGLGAVSMGSRRPQLWRWGPTNPRLPLNPKALPGSSLIQTAPPSTTPRSSRDEWGDNQFIMFDLLPHPNTVH